MQGGFWDTPILLFEEGELWRHASQQQADVDGEESNEDDTARQTTTTPAWLLVDGLSSS